MPTLRVTGSTKYVPSMGPGLGSISKKKQICFSISVFEVWLPLEKTNIRLKKFNLIQENRSDSPATWSHMDFLVQ